MKRILITLSAIALIAFAAQAQAGNMYAGVKLGANLGDVSGDDVPDDTSMRTGFMGGLFVGTHVNESFGFRLEGLYVQKGAKADIDYGPGIGVLETVEKLDYIEFPILFVYDLMNSETMGFNLFAGPTLGFNINAQAEPDGGESADIDNVKSFEFGAAIGAGIEKKMAGGKGIGLDVRYTLGATSIFEDVAGQSVDAKNRGIGIMASFSVPLGSSAQ